MSSYHDLVALLERHPKGLHIDVIAERLDLTVRRARARIDSARAVGKNIQKIAPFTFQLQRECIERDR